MLVQRVKTTGRFWLAGLAVACAGLARADDAEWAIYVMKADGSAARRVCRVEGFLAHGSARWSHDGKRLAFDVSGGPNGARKIFVVDVTGESLREIGENAATPDWAPDDKQLIFMRFGGEPSTWVQNLDGQGLTRLAAATCAHWSADGNQILFMDAAERSLLSLDLASEDQRVLLEGKYARIEPGFDWSPDAKRVAMIGVYPNDSRELLILEADGSQRVRLDKGRLEGAVSWSPDGKRLAMSVDFKVVILDADGNAPAGIVPGQTGRSTDPAWSPDGKWLVFGSDRAAE